MISEIKSYNELITKIKEKSFVLLYKKGSEISECALQNISDVYRDDSNYLVFYVDVSVTRDIHNKYNVTSVPSLLVFEDFKFANIVKGCMSNDYYNSLFNSIIYSSSNNNDSNNKKRVIVYTSTTCSWCNTIKSYLRKNNIQFREVDISKNQKAAAELIKKSGQQGVPQTEINGQIVVGFDQNKLNKLLNINQ